MEDIPIQNGKTNAEQAVKTEHEKGHVCVGLTRQVGTGAWYRPCVA